MKKRRSAHFFADQIDVITNFAVKTNVVIKRVHCIVNFPFLDGDVSRSTSYGVYISQLIRFARVVQSC